MKRLLEPVGKATYPPSQANPEAPDPNPKVGKTLWYDKRVPQPDCSAGFDYPVEFPKGADEQIECSVFGKQDNEKTYSQYGLDKKGD
jgi:hypothetical protein